MLFIEIVSIIFVNAFANIMIFTTFVTRCYTMSKRNVVVNQGYSTDFAILCCVLSKLIMNRSFKKDVALQAIMYILCKLGGKTDMHKLSKILYFADQQHLSLYGRSITGDCYIAMQYGPVPSKVDDMLKAVRGDSFFSGTPLADKLATYFRFLNNYIIESLQDPDLDYLSESDIECLDASIEKCKDLSFCQLTDLSHNIAWSNAPKNGLMSVQDILREVGDEEGYVNYITEKIYTESNCLS